MVPPGEDNLCYSSHENTALYSHYSTELLQHLFSLIREDAERSVSSWCPPTALIEPTLGLGMDQTLPAPQCPHGCHSWKLGHTGRHQAEPWWLWSKTRRCRGNRARSTVDWDGERPSAKSLLLLKGNPWRKQADVEIQSSALEERVGGEEKMCESLRVSKYGNSC